MSRVCAGAVAVTLLLGSGITGAPAQPEARDDAHLNTLRQMGRDPVEFVVDALQRHDLIIFDDALHNAVEPFEFYQALLRDARINTQVRYVFLETLSIAAQPHLDAYLESPTADRTLLSKAFQDDYSGYGWRYETYLDLLSTVWKINRALPEGRRIRVVGVDQPIYWEALHTRRDYDTFQDSLVARDYFLYRTIVARLNGFRDGTKAFFLTNTRHAYMRLRSREGRLHWNAAAFFDQHEPGRALSVRIHNVTLYVEAPAPTGARISTQGMERYVYRWARMEEGAWDRAFARNGNRPVAIPLGDNPFGRATYVGNIMLDVRADQTMADAYDALVFLAPLEQLRVSAHMDFFYTPAFREELKRRIRLLEGDGLAALLSKEGVVTLDELVDTVTKYQPQGRNTLVDSARP